MKNKLILCLALISLVSPAAVLVLDDPNPPAAGVFEYAVWRDMGAAGWTNVTTVKGKAWTIDLPSGTHTVAVSAVGALGPSDRSAPFVLARAVAVINLRVLQTLEVLP